MSIVCKCGLVCSDEDSIRVDGVCSDCLMEDHPWADAHHDKVKEMYDRRRCRCILLAMRVEGQDVPDKDVVEGWSEDEVEYFIANYGEYHLVKEDV